MPTPVELALASLLPHVTFPPEELQHLATSLLTQSRVHAPRLRPDEEVARTFTCAHLACERLQHHLALEIGKDVRPPCPPRVYARLKRFLDGALAPAQQQQQQTQQRAEQQRRQQSTPSKTSRGARLSQKHDEESTVVVATAKPESATKKIASLTPTGAAAQLKASLEVEGVPEFATPLLLRVCERCGIVEDAAGRVCAGAGNVVDEIASRRNLEVESGPASKRRRGRTTPRSKSQEEGTSPGHRRGVVPMSRWPALLLALLLCTVARMKSMGIDTEAMQDLKAKVIREAQAFITTESDPGLEEITDREIRDIEKMVTFYLLEAGDCGWLEMKWYIDIPAVVHEESSELEGGNDDKSPLLQSNMKKQSMSPKSRGRRYNNVGGGGMDGTGSAGLLPGLGTMFQPAVDWLSDERRAQYADWMERKLGDIAAIELEV